MCKKDLTPSEARKHRNGICISSRCMTLVKPYRKGGAKPLLCSACRRRDWAERNPEKYIYANLRGNARRRGKPFEITFEEYADFLREHNYLKRKRGRTKTSVSTDRVINELGYVRGNLAAITIQANSIKRNYVDYFRRQEENYYQNN